MRDGLRLVTDVDVVTASKNRIEAIFKNNKRVYVSFSGGKDSLAMSGVIEQLHDEGRIDITKGIWIFVDEEAIYPDLEDIVKKKRKYIQEQGAKFYWFCLPVKHFSCYNMLVEDESFICWDPRKKDVWIRKMPKFAIKDHELFEWGDTYQEFFEKIDDAPVLIGVRNDESIQRVRAYSDIIVDETTEHKKLYPIVDWRDHDVWLFLKDNNIEFPVSYLYMYKTGKRRLRISQFFSIDTASSLVSMFEYYPGLYEKILAREPNAYLAMYYWDTEMFRRTTRNRKELDSTGMDVSKAQVMEKMKMLKERDLKLYRTARRFMIRYEHIFTQATWDKLYGICVAGDVKQRNMRGLYSTLDYEGEQNG
ncbi:MAG: phosphoadenosine phosphosulfate reductase family protein [Candidatus Aegiribacteria sp.]|nr:phosphoadenosine phosphosulfate reductase family protein [Candidatus Aegiribacteria sp.]